MQQHTRYYRATTQRGVNLVELMIAMAVGAVILIGISSIFASSKKAYAVQDGLSRVQENGRFVLDFLTRDIRLAGFPQGTGPVAMDNATTTNGPIGAPDQITLRYNPPTPVSSDCNGNLVTPISNKYDIQINGNGRAGLFCNDIELITGIDSIQFLYGLDTDNIPDGVANTYITANNVAGLWSRVVSIRLAVLANSINQSSNIKTKGTYTLLGNDIAGFNDNKARRIFTTTVMLRNNI